MKKAKFYNPLKAGLQFILLLAISTFSLGSSNLNVAHAGAALNSSACGQMLADAEAQFLKTLAPDGSVPASPEAKAAAQEYIRVSKLCYEEIEAQASAENLQGETPMFIDDGGLLLGQESSAEFVLTGNRWGTGSSTPTVTYSFMGNGISFSGEGYGNSIAITALPRFSACYITEIQNAFAAWQAVSNIRFVQVTDNGAAFDAPGAIGDIRIAGHAFDGVSGTLAHAYFPPPNGNSAAGDMHFDSAENWTCNTSGVDIGVVALHEIGHSLGLKHEDTSRTAVMDPVYNPNLTGLQPDDINGVMAIYGPAQLVAPGNDNFANATPFNSLPYNNSVDTTSATEQDADPQVNISCDGSLLNKGRKNVWYLYSPAANASVILDTIGSDYDTYIAVWTGTSLNNLTLVGCDDDTEAGLESQLTLNAVGGTNYYIEIAEYAGAVPSPRTPGTGGSLEFHANLANAEITIGGVSRGKYYIPSGGRVTPSFAGVQTGPVKVTTGTPMFVSERSLYGPYSTFNEVMGFPNNQLTTRYWFPWYDNKDMTTWILVGNPSGNLNANVTIKIAGQTVYNKQLGPNGIDTPTFGTTQNGPVEVISDNPIFTSERALYGAASSFNEVMGFPNNQLTTRYWFPWYDNKDMKSWILVGNPSTTLTANVTIKIAGQIVYSQPLGPNGIATPTFGTLQGGPVEVISDNPILTSERSLYGPYGTFNEVMGFPNNQLTTRYWFPWYDNKDMSSWVLVANPSTNQSANVTIKIAGQTVYSQPLGPNGIATPMFGTIQNGPVEVISDIPIFTSERAVYGPASSFNEVMGFPNNQLTTDYWFTWYDGKDMSTWILVGRP